MIPTETVYRTLGEIVDTLGGELVGSPDLRIRQVATLEAAVADEISFLASHHYRPQLDRTHAGAVVLGTPDRDATARPRIVAESPYLYFARLSALLNPPLAVRPGIHAAAAVHPEARIAPDAQIDACAVVGARAVVGAAAVIGPGCVVEEGASVGAGSRLAPNVVVRTDCVVGARCILHPGVVIGGDGFGMAESEGRWVKVPQIGRAILGDDVEVGANTTIDRGALGDTVIEDGVKLDNLIQIAHNVVIGAHTAVAACAGFAGSSRIGKYCRIGGAAMIHGHIEICDRTIVAAGTMVRKSITTPGIYDGFFPALPHRDWMKNLAHFNRLHEHADTIRKLEARIDALERGKL
jgi:UDP-3-O-[3-hydroxymyristoyl] glucosamine N-acyltransferase